MKAAVIGLGKIGYLFGLDTKRFQPASHFHCYNSLPKVDRIALCDMNSELLETISKQLPHKPMRYRFYHNYSDMLREFEPQVVSITTPTSTHREIAVAAAQTPSVDSIFLEKPIAQNLRDAREIIEVCDRQNVKLTVNYTRRWNQFCIQLAEDAKALSEPKEIIGIHPGPLLRTGTHMIDLFNMIIDKPILEVTNFGNAVMNYLQGIDLNINDWNLNGWILYEDASQATLISGLQKPYVLFEIDVFVGEKRFRLINNCNRYEKYSAMDSDRYEGLQELYPESNYDMIQQIKNPLFMAVKEVCDIDAPSSCTGEDAYKTLQTALMIHYSNTHLSSSVQKEEVFDYEAKTY